MPSQASRTSVLVLAVCGLVAIPASAGAAHRLYLKQARAVTARMAKAEIKRSSYYPDYITASAPACKRNSATRATCDYTVKTNIRRQQPPTYDYCKRRVYVRLIHGRAIGRKANLDCYLQQTNGNSDYEP